MQKLMYLILGTTLVCLLGGTSIAGEKQGKHIGELKNLEIKIAYTDPYFYTPEGFAGYYIGLPMTYEVRIANNSQRTFKHLDVTAIQEYYESGICNRWWYPYPREVQYYKGEPLPGDSTAKWHDVSLGPNEKIVLGAGYTPPLSTCDGLDQTHVIIQHTNKGKVEAAVIYYEPECGVFCPPPPSK